MLLLNSTSDFTIENIPHPDLPLLVNSEMMVVESVIRFIVYQSIQNGRVSSARTIRNYANALYDYFSFLEANNLSWDTSPENGVNHSVSIVALYRNWSASLKGDAALKRSTINTRLAAIRQFYEFCHNRGLIDSLPWEHTLKPRMHDSADFLRHIRTNKPIDSTDLRLKTFKEPPKVLNIEQAKLLVAAISSKTLLLIVKLALTTGLRREELITFQRKCVLKPAQSQMNSRLAVDLLPSEGGQKTKGNRPRTIYIPAPLMFEIYDYMHWGEGVRRHALSTGNDQSKVFLTGAGKEYAETSLNTLLAKLKSAGRIDFSVTPHMLRHYPDNFIMPSKFSIIA